MAKKPAAMPSTPTYPVNPALEAAVIAHAEEDTPRLVYADWLDENGDPNRAAFIRTQVALWDKHPADADYIDLTERLASVMPAMMRRLKAASFNTPVNFWPSEGDEGADSESSGFHRGFPYLAGNFSRGDPHERLPHSVEKKLLAQMVRETTIRGIGVSNPPLGELEKLLATRAAQQLSCIRLDDDDGIPSILEVLLASPVAESLHWLIAESHIDNLSGLRALTKTRALGRLRRLTCEEPGVSSNARTKQFHKVLSTDWFRQLHSLTLQAVCDDDAFEALAGHPALHTLIIQSWSADPHRGLRKLGTLPDLGRLSVSGQHFPKGAARGLAKVELPRLAVLEVNSIMPDEDVKLLASSPLFDHLTRLSLRTEQIRRPGVEAIAKSPCAANLRSLDLGHGPLDKSGLAAVLKPGAFPKLTTLTLETWGQHAIPARELAPILANLHLPGLRHLDISGWPIGDAGARALAKNATLSAVRILELGECAIGSQGIAALAASPHLQGLVKLNLSGCSLRSKADLFADKTVLPNLAWLRLPEDVSDDVKTRLLAARPEIFPS